MLENPICAVNRMSRCYWLDTGGRLRPNHVKRTDLGREPPFLTKSKGGSRIIKRGVENNIGLYIRILLRSVTPLTVTAQVGILP